MSLHLVLGSASPARYQTLVNASLSPIRWPADTDEDSIYQALWPQQPPEIVVTTLARSKARAVAKQIFSAWHMLANGLSQNDNLQMLDLKQLAFLERLQPGDEILLLGADSMLLLDGNLQGKPHSTLRARAQIDQLAQKSPILYSGHCIQRWTLPATLTTGQEFSTDAWSALIFPADHFSFSDPLAPPIRLSKLSPTTPVSQYFWTGTIPTTLPSTTRPTDFSGAEALGCSSSTVHFGPISAAEADAYVATGEPLEVAGGFTIDGRGAAFIEGISGDYHNIVGISLPLLRILADQIGIFWPDLWK